MATIQGRVSSNSKKKTKKILTVNGFTPEFEREVLRAEKEADAGSVVEWDGK